MFFVALLSRRDVLFCTSHWLDTLGIRRYCQRGVPWNTSLTIRAFALTYFATLNTVRVFIFNTLPIRPVEMKRIDNDDSNIPKSPYPTHIVYISSTRHNNRRI